MHLAHPERSPATIAPTGPCIITPDSRSKNPRVDKLLGFPLFGMISPHTNKNQLGLNSQICRFSRTRSPTHSPNAPLYPSSPKRHPGHAQPRAQQRPLRHGRHLRHPARGDPLRREISKDDAPRSAAKRSEARRASGVDYGGTEQDAVGWNGAGQSGTRQCHPASFSLRRRRRRAAQGGRRDFGLLSRGGPASWRIGDPQIRGPQV